MTDSNDLLDTLGLEIRQSQDEALETGSVRAQVRQRVLSQSHRQRQDRRSRWLLVPAAAVVLLAAGSWLLHEEPLEYAIAGDTENARLGQLLAAEQHPMHLSFSDGSGVRLAPEAQASVPVVWENGALVQVHGGSVHFDIEHRQDTRWAVQAGPYTVHVVGTTFDVDWDEQSRTFLVDVSEGRVRLEGPDTDGVEVAAGDALRLQPQPERFGEALPETEDEPAALASEGADVPQGEPALEVDGQPEQPGHGAAEVEGLVGEQRPSGAAPAEAVGASEVRQPTRPWRRLAANRDFVGALAALDHRGFDSTLRRMSAAELYEVAGWARQASDPRATRLYEQVRRRSPGSTQAANAAFLLGRMSGSRSDALRWWLVYEDEQPTGRFAEQNAGRILETLSALGRRAEAAERAEQYLGRYPEGAHRRLAEALAR